MPVYRAKQTLERYANGESSELEFVGVRAYCPTVCTAPNPWVAKAWVLHEPFGKPQIISGERLDRALLHFFIMKCPDRTVT